MAHFAPFQGLRVAGESRLAAELAAQLGDGPPSACLFTTLVNADHPADPAAITGRCTAFAATIPDAAEALVVTILHAAPPGLAAFGAHAANAALWAFTQQAALEWAPRRIRVNAIGLGVSPAGPFEATEQSGRAAAPLPAAPATTEDIARTLRAIAAWPSMTGQIIRLGI